MKSDFNQSIVLALVNLSEKYKNTPPIENVEGHSWILEYYKWKQLRAYLDITKF